MANDLCERCGLRPQECSVVLCAPCALCDAPTTLEHGHSSSDTPRRPFIWFDEKQKLTPAKLRAARR